MTKEECIGLLKRYADYEGIGIPNLAGCREAMRMAAELLEKPSLPSDLDEAANNYCIDIRRGYPRVMDETDRYIYNAFKAGAEWMAGQFQKVEGRLIDWYETNGVDYCCGISTDEAFEVPEGFYIRKK